MSLFGNPLGGEILLPIVCTLSLLNDIFSFFPSLRWRRYSRCSSKSLYALQTVLRPRPGHALYDACPNPRFGHAPAVWRRKYER